MDQIKVYYDETGQTLTVWFDDPNKEVISEEVGDDVILMKGDDGTVLGFEKLNVKYHNPKDLSVAFSKFHE
jgi:uncharacterized protein YuzE